MESIQEITGLLQKVRSALKHLLRLLFVVGVTGGATVPAELKPLREFGPEKGLPVGFAELRR